jgi:hypothetical protein
VARSGKFFWTSGKSAKDRTKASKIRKRSGEALNAKSGMAKKQPNKRTEISIQTVTV